MDKIAIVGAGQMGGGIAQICAATGFEVALSDTNLDRASTGKASIAARLSNLVKKGKLSEAEHDATLARIRASVASCSASESFPFLTRFESRAAMLALPVDARSRFVSDRATSKPVAAQICAMPPPICPAPTIAILSMITSLPCAGY